MPRLTPKMKILSILVKNYQKLVIGPFTWCAVLHEF